ncbi:peptidoglycan-binding protein [Xanthomonas hyacinthi]|nr:peptidoglycan-binding protein [Xanthomonas hyacinthi]
MATTDRENQLLGDAYAAGISNPGELANFMAQVGHESGGLNRLEESFRYTKGSWQITANVRSALREGPEALESARLEALNGRPERLAELMYGGRMGNDEPGDGLRYHGRGYIQLTGKDQYRAAGEALELDLVNHPELAAQPENASRIATWYWQQNVPTAARDSAREAGAAINGSDPPNGLQDRENRFDRWERDLTPELMQNLAHGRLGQTVPPPARADHQPAAAAHTTRSDFQQTMERMLPGQGGTDPHITGHYGEHRGNRGEHGSTDFNYEGGQAGRNLQHPTVHAPIAGTVTFSGGQYGTVKIRDAQGNSHEILHLDSRSVQEGQTVRAGDPIGTMGGRDPDGRAQYAQHVHYQMRDPSGRNISPETWWNQGRQVEAGERGQHQGTSETLRHGDRSEDVRKLQQQLNQLGVHDAHGRPLTEDGRFGDNTRDAVRTYQQAHGLQVDGKAGAQTLGSLREQLRAPQEQAHAAQNRGPAAAPENALVKTVRERMPEGTTPEVAANVALQAKQNGIDSADKLRSITVQDDKAYVLGTTPGFRAVVDLQQPAPPLEQTNAQLLASQAAQQQNVQEAQQRIVQGGR